MSRRAQHAQVFRTQDDRPAAALLLHEMRPRSRTGRLGPEARSEEAARQRVPAV